MLLPAGGFFRTPCVGRDRFVYCGFTFRKPDGAGPFSYDSQSPGCSNLFSFPRPSVTIAIKIYPDYKAILTIYLDQTPSEITDAATAALRKEIGHL
jgi:hypothetical protein